MQYKLIKLLDLRLHEYAQEIQSLRMQLTNATRLLSAANQKFAELPKEPSRIII
jgi:hypothetical protein